MLHNYAQDKFSEPKGFFIEAGAGDGEIISNSLYFELKYGVNTILCYLIKSLNGQHFFIKESVSSTIYFFFHELVDWFISRA